MQKLEIKPSILDFGEI